MIEQAFATVNNYFFTGQDNKAVRMLGQLKKIAPNDARVDKFIIALAHDTHPGMDDIFGAHWRGESLDGLAIEVFCDQGMGDTIQLLRYLKAMKERWDCHIVLNVYAYFDEMFSLLNEIPYIDLVVKEHNKCDYQTNILSVPGILNDIHHRIPYPVRFNEILETKIPDQELIKSTNDLDWNKDLLNVGLVWRSNPKNELCIKKSLPSELAQHFLEYHWKLHSLTLDDDVLTKPDIKTVLDTVNMIAQCDVIVSVDTLVLHLSGSMGKTTYGLLPEEADPRWGKSEDTIWYPSVKLFRQEADDWMSPITEIKEKLVEHARNKKTNF
jgi:hypothetical protein